MYMNHANAVVWGGVIVHNLTLMNMNLKVVMKNNSKDFLGETSIFY